MGQTMESVTFVLLLYVYVADNNIDHYFFLCDRSWNYISGIS